MTYDYVITLKRPGYGLVDMISQLMYVFAIAILGFYTYQHRTATVSALVFMIIIVAAIIVLWLLAWRKKRVHGVAYFRLGLFIAAIGFLTQQIHSMAILYAIAGLLEGQVKFAQEIGFSAHEIAFNSFPKRIVKWSDCNNVVIKDGLITLDYKDNKLVQKEIDQSVPLHVEREFNEFCRKMLESEIVCSA